MILTTPDAITPVRLTEILRSTGAIVEACVSSLRCEPIGVGLMGDTMRYHIGYDLIEAGAPATLAGKFAAVDPHARAAGGELGIYLTEVRFYQQIARSVPVRAPRCYYSEIDAETLEFGLLMEDVAPARAVDQMAGCTREEAQHALLQAARLHAPRFGDESLWSIDWMAARYRVYSQTCVNMSKYIRIFQDRFAGVLEHEYMKLAEGFALVAGEFAIKRPERYSLIHGDFRLDNMLFDILDGQEPMAVLDWQSVSVANPGIDFAYLLGISYPAENRSRDEKDLLRFYHDQMQAGGVRDYAWDDLWLDYRRGAWLGLMTAIFASAVAKQTERGDRLFLHMARGAAAQMLEHDTLLLA